MTTFNLPDLGEGLAEAEIVRWHVKAGDQVKMDQPLLAVETAKAVVEVPSPYSGLIKALHGKAGDVVATGAALVDFELAGTAAPGAQGKDAATVVGNMPRSDRELIETAVAGNTIAASAGRVRAAPAVRAVAKRMGVDLTSIKGSGPAGSITLDDVMEVTTPAAMARKPQPDPASAPLLQGEERLRGLRRTMAQSMSLSRDNVMNCTLFDDADIHQWRKGEDLTVRLLRAIGVAARAEPVLNAWFDGEREARRLMEHVDVGVAVDTADGLLVPVIRDVGGRSAEALRADIDRLKRTARDRTVAAEELRGFTFMLSNFGTIAGRYATPVVVPPAVAILGAGRLSRDVVAAAGGIEAHLRMPLSITFDHRCVTGGEAARFLAALIRDLELGS
jgi:2-oxoisovalerate dehydrogenase E2 component (dihydrolipoyl transacylase)